MISIVSHGQEALVRRFIESLDMFLVADGFRVEIIVRENKDRTFPLNIKSKFPISVFLNDSPRGFGANHNLNFSIFQCDFFIVANPDVVLLQPCNLSDFRLLPHRFLASATILERDGSVADFKRSIPTPAALLERWVLRGGPSYKSGQQLWFAGIFLITPAYIFEELGGFDESYFMYIEDCDLSMRAVALNVNLVPLYDWFVLHDAQRASRRIGRHMVWHISSLLRLWWRLLFRSF